MSKSPRKTLFLIIALTLLALYVDLPRLSFKNLYFVHPEPLKNFIKRDLEPKLGLDLAGGVQLTMSADMSQIEAGNRDDALESAKNIVENRINSLGVAEPQVQTAKTNDQYRLLIEIPGITDIDKAVAIVKKTAHLEFRTIKADAPPEATLGAFPDYFESSGLTGAQLKRTQAQASQDSQKPGYVVAIEFNDEGAKKFEEITRNNVGRQVAIFLDEDMISAPVVNTVISEGRGIIEGNFSSQGARQLAIELNAGALPAPLKIESQSRIGPTIGVDAIHKSITATIIGLTSVAIFMVFYYETLGIFAVVSLLIYSLITLAVFKLIPVTLTLAGIAGFVLSIGMAVDANILIFERIKEEMKWGKPKHEALYAGFNRAWTSIRDSNVSSLITTVILFNFGTGSIRGFALTLAIGILISMFSAITVSRTLLRIFWVRKIS
ncbi:MAG: protein translocase subunit SecD [Candidatus Curtissbacteria bacterium]|nr:protein translocase subunit SecD [Candidatus Curtissbacteria bacterium]